MPLFNVRVYGVLIDAANRLLVSDEYIKGGYFTKLPGGGLEFGEGTRDCLIREYMEETGLTISVGDHLYTTDFFQMSAFKKTDQIISIYYYVRCEDLAVIKTTTTPFDFTADQVADPNGTAESFRWVEWEHLTEDTMHLPIDKVAIKLLKEQFAV